MGCPHPNRVRYSVPIDTDKTPKEETYVHRNPISKDKLITTIKGDEDVTTVQTLYKRSFKKFADRPFLGSRERIKTDSFGEYKFKTYKECEEIGRKIGSAIEKKGFAPVVKDDNMKNKFVGIWAQNCEEWLLLDIACTMYGLTNIPIYSTLGPEIVQFVLKMTKLSTIFCSADHTDELIENATKGDYKTLKNVVIFGETKHKDKIRAEQAGFNLISWQELLDFSTDEILPLAEVKPEDLYTICYTSGTTGTPKGAMLSHKAQTATIAATHYRTDFNIFEKDVYYSYLPLAHCMERSGLLFMMSKGMAVGFTTNVKIEMSHDIKALKPTIFFGVPKVYSRIKEGMEKQINKLSLPQRLFVQSCIKMKLLNLKLFGVVSHPVVDPIVFKKMRDAMGGKLRYCATGAAPIDEETINFLRIAWSVPMLEGYGPTEGCAFNFLSSAKSTTHGPVGGPMGCLEFKLVDDKEMKYTAQDEEGPRGEVYFRGPCAFDGYYKQPEKTEENLTKDGWVLTGDIGMINKDGSLSIIDKKKSMFKLSQGEYVAGDKVEDAMKKSKYVEEMFIYGESSKSYLVAIVVPKEREITSLAKQLNVGGAYEDQLKNEEIKKKVLEDLNKCGQEKKLNGYELAKNIHLEKRSFKDMDIMTPTEKLKRGEAKKVLEKEIQKMYEKELGGAGKKDQ